MSMIQNPDRKLSEATVSDLSEVMVSQLDDIQHEVLIRTEFPDGNYHRLSAMSVSNYESHKLSYCMDEFFRSKDLSLDRELSLDGLGEIVPIRTTIDFGDKTVSVLKNGYAIYVGENNYKIIIRIVFEEYDSSWHYQLFASDDASEFLQEWQEFAKERNPYRGKKITPGCRILDIPDHDWDDIVLPQKTVSVIKRNISELFELYPILKELELSIKRGIILAGPPGTGKTMLCKTIANKAECSVLYVLPADLTKVWNVRQICNMAKDLAPCLMILEDLDWIAEDRKSSGGMVMELMNQLDGLEAMEDVITIGTTNEVEVIEKAIKNRPGRFDRVIDIGVPDKDCRERMVRKFTERFSVDPDLKIDAIVAETDKFSGAHMQELCNTAVLFAVRENSKNEDGEYFVTNKHFAEAFCEVSDKDFATFLKKKGVGFAAQESRPSFFDDLY